MAKIKIHNLQSAEQTLVNLTNAETLEIKGGFRQLFAAVAIISGVNSSSSSPSTNSETFEQRLQRINAEVNQIYNLAWAIQTAAGFIGIGGSGFGSIR